MSLERLSINNNSIDKSVKIDKYHFSNRADYKNFFIAHGVATSGEDIWQNDRLVVAAQTHWHTRGQNGCVFAQATATHAERYGWDSKVMREESYRDENIGAIIDRAFTTAVRDEKCENLSLLFPTVDTPDKLVHLLKSIKDTSSTITVSDITYDDHTIVALRGRFDTDNVESWIVGFAPFDFLPNTRQAPFTELAIRTKKKPTVIFEKLNQDNTAAHLADIPLGLKDEVMDTLLEKTRERTQIILGDTPRKLAAAKVTYAIPSEHWRGLRP